VKRGFASALVLVALLVGLWAVVASATAGQGSFDSSDKLRKKVTVDGVMKHLEEFQEIADANGDNRASGFPGFDASSEYVQDKLEQAGWQVTTQPFDFDVFLQDSPAVFEQTAPEEVEYVEDTDYSVQEYSGSGDVTAELVAVDLVIPPGEEASTSNSGCEPEDFDAAVVGKIALMQRGTCDFRVKVDNAAAAGAIGSLIFNEGQEGRTDVVFGTLGPPLADIPAIDTSFALGEELANGETDGPTGVTVHIKTDTSSETRSTENVIAETPGGDPENVVMAGAHLDSVAEGPGINDNGSGSAALIEIARQISKTGLETDQKLRFAWWGAEEANLIGSTEYVDGLSEEEGGDIAVYLNFDMIGSPNFARFIYDGNGSKFEGAGPEGSDTIERVFERYFERQDLASGQTAFDGRSDYGPFIDVGIPAGGLFTGAEDSKSEHEQAVYGGTEGEAYDPCYHQACDDIDNLSLRALGQMSDAVAHSVVHFGNSLKFIPRPEEPAPPKADKRGPGKTVDGKAIR
jgi:Zn-dependent M28 family amino/carboxypeptidase